MNDKLNVSKKYYKQVRSMLYAWKAFGYVNAEKEHISKYYKKHRPSDKTPSLQSILHGKLLYMRMVKGAYDSKYAKCAKIFNQCCQDKTFQLSYIDPIDIKCGLRDMAMFVLEFYSDAILDDDGNCETIQGTGFYVDGIGLVTCNHILPDDGIDAEVEAFNPNKFSKKYSVRIIKRWKQHDLAVCKIYCEGDEFIPSSRFKLLSKSPTDNSEIVLYGFPSYSDGATTTVQEGKIVNHYPYHGIKYFEVNFQVRGGVSGGPVLDKNLNVIGIALKGATQDFGKNEILTVDEINKQFKEAGLI